MINVFFFLPRVIHAKSFGTVIHNRYLPCILATKDLTFMRVDVTSKCHCFNLSILKKPSFSLKYFYIQTH